MNILAYLKKYGILPLKNTEMLVHDKNGWKLVKFVHEYDTVFALQDMLKSK